MGLDLILIQYIEILSSKNLHIQKNSFIKFLSPKFRYVVKKLWQSSNGVRKDFDFEANFQNFELGQKFSTSNESTIMRFSSTTILAKPPANDTSAIIVNNIEQPSILNLESQGNLQIQSSFSVSCSIYSKQQQQKILENEDFKICSYCEKY